MDKSHSREIGGTGLGLAITRSAVVAHRGAIKVQSTVDEGTTFIVRFRSGILSKEGNNDEEMVYKIPSDVYAAGPGWLRKQ